jgi:Uma2 family endonuclease
MTMSSLSEPYFTPEEYLELENKAETKSEYISGQIYAMSGASIPHNIITANVIGSLYAQLRGKPYRVYPGDLRVKVPATDLYTYPDVVVICGRPELDERDPMTVTNPSVIVEVLSPSTEAYDRGAKFAHYRRLDTLTDYLLISQDKMQSEHYSKWSDKQWLLRISESGTDRVEISSIGCDLLLSDLYEDVDWSTTELEN